MNRSDRKSGICRSFGGGGNRTRERFLPLNRLLSFAAVFVLMVLLLGRAVDQEFAHASTPVVVSHYEQVRRIICVTFGPECAKAQRVAWCESRLNVYAVGNRYGADPYWGLFQQGAYSRARYGFGWSAVAQARAAKRHRDAEGWRPWPVCGRR